MGLIDEILKGLPVNPALREKIKELDAQKAAAGTHYEPTQKGRALLVAKGLV